MVSFATQQDSVEEEEKSHLKWKEVFVTIGTLPVPSTPTTNAPLNLYTHTALLQ